MKHLFWTPAAFALLAAGCQPSTGDKVPESGTAATAAIGAATDASAASPVETPAPHTMSTPEPAPPANDMAALPPADPVKTESGVRTQISDADCGADKVKAYIGKEAIDTVRAEVAAKSGAKSLRWITPDTMVTMDLRHDRLNAHLGTDNKIGSLRCG